MKIILQISFEYSNIQFYKNFISPMVYILKNIKEPDGINDIQTIHYKNNTCFAATYGKLIKIFNEHGKLLESFTTQAYIQKIVPYENLYFLVACDRYLIYKDTNRLAFEYFGCLFENIQKIILLNDRFIIFHKGAYTLGTILNNKMTISKELTDAAFYRISGSAKNENTIFIIAKTINSNYILKYTLENKILKLCRKEIINVNFIFTFFNRVFLIGNNKIYEYLEKPIFLCDFGNTKICLIFNNLLFCENGEIYEIFQENQKVHFKVALILDCAISSASKIGNLYFFGSLNFSYFVDSNYKIIERFDGLGNIMNLKCANRGISFLSNGCYVKMMKLIHNNINTPHGSLKAVFKTDTVSILTYKNYSILNNKVFNKINTCHFFKSSESLCSYTVISTDTQLIIFNKDLITICEIKCIIIKYCKNKAYIYTDNQIIILNLETLESIYTFTDLHVYDLVPENENLSIVTFEDKIKNISEFEPHRIIYKIQETPLECNSIDYDNIDIHVDAHMATLALFKDNITSTCLNIISINEKLYKIENSQLILLHTFDSYILHITQLNNNLFISCINGLYFFDQNTKILNKFDLNSEYTFTSNNILYGCVNGQIQPIPISNPVYIVKYTPIGLNKAFKIIYCDHKNTVRLFLSIEMSTLSLQLNDSEPVLFEKYLENGFTTIRKNLFAVCMININTNESKLILFKIKSKKLKIHKIAILKEIPLLICSLENTIAIIFAKSINIYKLRNNQIKFINKIVHKNCFCINSLFLNKGILAIATNDWGFQLVNIKRGSVRFYGTVTEASPFFYNKKVGYAVKHQIHYCEIIIDYGEEIVGVLEIEQELFIFGRNGAISIFKHVELPYEDERYLRKMKINSINLSPDYIDMDYLSKVTDDSMCKRIADYLNDN